MNLYCIKYFIVSKDQIVQENKVSQDAEYFKRTLKKNSNNIIHVGAHKFIRYETDFFQSVCDNLNFLFNYMETPTINQKFMNIDLKQVFLTLEYPQEIIYQCIEKTTDGFTCFYYKEMTNLERKMLDLAKNEVVYYKDGQKMYEGDTENGSGKYFSNDGVLLYEGHFKNKLFHGEGKQYIPYGIVFEGQFENGKKKGFGTFYQEDRKIFEGNIEEK